MRMRTPWLIGASLVAGLACAPATAQVRVVVDGQVYEIPDGVVRTISYEPGGRQSVRDEPFAGEAAPGSATITTTETTDEDEDGRPIHVSVVTRVEPIAAAAYAPAMRAAVYVEAPETAAAEPAPRLDIDADAFAAPDPASAVPRTVRIRRDPATGHFITAIRINGVRVQAIVDTGAQNTILSARDARASGASRNIVRTQAMAGIGGYTLLNVTRIRSLEVGGQQLGGVTASIGQDGIPYTLLGQTEIARLGRIVIEDGVMTITPASARLASR